MQFYWQIGHEVLERQGSPAQTYFNSRAFAEAYPDPAIVQQLLHNSPLPWGHHVRLLDHEHSWSQAILEHQTVCSESISRKLSGE